VPRKNIKLLVGKPLIQYTIDAALESEFITDVMVSTEDLEIAEISKQLGAKIPQLRPMELAADTSPTIDTMVYTVEYYKSLGIYFDTVVLLQPTSPFRTFKDIDAALKIFIKEDTDSLISVIKVPHEYNPYWVFKESQENILNLAITQENIISRRQDLPNCFIRNGAIYITKVDCILEQKSIYGQSIAYYDMSNNQPHVNIDTIEDWDKAEQIMNNKIIS
jgi:CMP-N,N'-diacetyllegionaminic acid synthase